MLFKDCWWCICHRTRKSECGYYNWAYLIMDFKKVFFFFNEKVKYYLLLDCKCLFSLCHEKKLCWWLKLTACLCCAAAFFLVDELLTFLGAVGARHLRTLDGFTHYTHGIFVTRTIVALADPCFTGLQAEHRKYLDEICSLCLDTQKPTHTYLFGLPVRPNTI